MTLKELQKEVAALSFSQNIECDKIFLSAVNRALLVIFKELGLKGVARLVATLPEVLSFTPLVRHSAGSSVTLPLVGRAYSMRLYGTGSFVLRDGHESHTESFCANGELFHGVLKSGGSITFLGDEHFLVGSLAVYETPPVSGFEELPGGIRRYSLDSVGDFIAPAGPVLDSLGRKIEGAEVKGNAITLSSDYEGEMTLEYLRAPHTLRGDPSERMPELPRGADAALPLLTAYYLLLEEDPELAEGHLAAYRDCIGTLKSPLYSEPYEEYKIFDRWA